MWNRSSGQIFSKKKGMKGGVLQFLISLALAMFLTLPF